MIRAPAAKSLKGMWIKNHLSTPHSLRFQQALIVIFGVKRYNYGGYAHFHILYYVLLRSNTFLSIASPIIIFSYAEHRLKGLSPPEQFFIF